MPCSAARPGRFFPDMLRHKLENRANSNENLKIPDFMVEICLIYVIIDPKYPE
jgi:hypothetical protein